MKLPELHIHGASIKGVSKLAPNAEGYLIEWKGQLVGVVIFGRSGWVGRKLYQPLDLRGRAQGQPVPSLKAATLRLIEQWETSHDRQ